MRFKTRFHNSPLTPALIGLAATTLSMQALAADPPVYSHCSTAAASGADVVAYYSLEPGADAVIGSPDFTHDWNGASWHFANQENLDKFASNPTQYAPEYGGYCAFAASHGFTMYTIPNAWEIVDGKLYLNKSKGVQKRWKRDLAQKIVNADQNWPVLLDQCEKKGKCRPCWKK